jgi:hypothetical protein
MNNINTFHFIPRLFLPSAVEIVSFGWDLGLARV